jgi:hypothetical protein
LEKRATGDWGSPKNVGVNSPDRAFKSSGYLGLLEREIEHAHCIEASVHAGYLKHSKKEIWLGSLKERCNSEDLWVDGRTILK